jgi:ribose transport system ATP-binding protein
MTVQELQTTVPAGRPVVTLKGLTKTFGDQRALDAVDLTLRHGEVTALIGENGSGKSTLIKCLTGVYQPDGRGQLDWTDGTSDGCVVVHQDLGLITGLTVAENFGVGLGFAQGRFGQIAWKRQNAAVQEVLDAARIDVSATARIENLTLAQQTVVAIARALHESQTKVSLIILDEPTAALPFDEREQVLDTVRTLRERGIAILYVSHHLDEIAEIGDRVIVLRAGVLEHDRVNTGLTAPDLLTMMSGELEIASNTAAADQDAEVVLSVDHLGTNLLRGITFELRRGEILGILGALDSGAGQVCRAIAGTIGYTGTISVEGATLRPGSVTDRVHHRIFMVPSDRRAHGIIGTLDVTDNIRLASLRRGSMLAPVSRKAARREVADAMETLDIRPRDPSRKVAMLSGGNQQKVVLARALAQDPTVMVLENPTQGVDPAARLQIRAAIRAAAARGLTVVVSDVDEAEIVAIAHRVIRLDSGVVIDTSDAHQG